MITGLHHVGMEATDLDAQCLSYEALGFNTIHQVRYPTIGRAAMLEQGSVRLEIFQFDNVNSALATIIKNHTAFSTDNLEGDLQTFLDNGYELAIPIDTGDVVKRYAYVKDTSGNYIELCEPNETY